MYTQSEVSCDNAALSLLSISIGSDLLQSLDGSCCVLHALSRVKSNKRHLKHGLEPVTTSHDQRRSSSGDNGGNHNVPLLCEDDATVPVAPDLGRSKHATTSVHVPKCSLFGTVDIAVGNTRHSTSGIPRLGRGLVTDFLVDSVWLVLVVVDKMDDGETDGSLHVIR